MRIYNYVFFILILFVASCKRQENKPVLTDSKLLRFEYGPYGDTICASLSGFIYTFNDSIKKPLDSVKIVFNSKHKFPKGTQMWFYNSKDTIRQTSKSGQFSICLMSDTFSLRFEKVGYQTLILENYEASGDQFSELEAVLSKGSGEKKIDVRKKEK